MRYDLLSRDEREQMREEARQRVVEELRALERRHYQAELAYRLASALEPQDETAMAAARAEQGAVDVEYAALRPRFEALRDRQGGQSS